MILRIAGRPPRNFYSGPDDRANLPAGEASHQLLSNPGVLRSSADGELSNNTAALADPALALLANLPLGADAALTDAGAVIHSGRVVRIEWQPGAVFVEIQP